MKWTVITNKQETAIANTVTFHPERRVPFKAGQFFLLSAFIDGKKVKRAYSAASGPARERINVTSKLSDKPTFSRLLFDIQEGDFLDVEGPFGKFTFETGDAQSLVLIAGGSGIAPMMSIIEHCIDERLDIPIHLLFSSKTEDLIIYKDQWKELEAQYPKLRVHLTLTQELWEGLNGRIDAKMVEDCAGDLSVHTYYICGPPQMVNTIQKELIGKGVDAADIRTERYN